jgi:hypothetical protein
MHSGPYYNYMYHRKNLAYVTQDRGYAYKLFVTIVQLGLPFWQFADFGGGLHTVFAKLKSLEITPIVTADCL